jgi:hypothetical protein
MKKLLVSLFVLLALVAALTPSVLQFFAQRQITALQAQGHRFKVRDLQGHFIGLSASSVEGSIPLRIDNGRRAVPVSVELSDVDVRVGWSLPPSIYLRAMAYDGIIEVAAPILTRSPSLSFTVTNLDLSQHPQMRPAGLTSGRLTISGSNISLDPKARLASDLSVNLQELGVETLPIVAQFTKINVIRDGSLQAEVHTKEDGSVTVDPISVNSSLGGARGRASGILPSPGTPITFNANIRFQLSEDEGAQLSNWLPIITNNAIDSSRRAFSLQVRSVPCSGPFSARAGDICVNQTFTN